MIPVISHSWVSICKKFMYWGCFQITLREVFAERGEAPQCSGPSAISPSLDAYQASLKFIFQARKYIIILARLQVTIACNRAQNIGQPCSTVLFLQGLLLIRSSLLEAHSTIMCHVDWKLSYTSHSVKINWIWINWSIKRKNICTVFIAPIMCLLFCLFVCLCLCFVFFCTFWPVAFIRCTT